MCSALIMYDRPPHIFRMLTNAEKHEVCVCVCVCVCVFKCSYLDLENTHYFTIFMLAGCVCVSLQLFVRLSQTEKIFKAPDDDSAKSKSNVYVPFFARSLCFILMVIVLTLLGCGILASHSVRTAFSVKAPTGIRLLDNRPFLVVSSTSWTGGCVGLLSLGFLSVGLIPFVCGEREGERVK